MSSIPSCHPGADYRHPSRFLVGAPRGDPQPPPKRAKRAGEGVGDRPEERRHKSDWGADNPRLGDSKELGTAIFGPTTCL